MKWIPLAAVALVVGGGAWGAMRLFTAGPSAPDLATLPTTPVKSGTLVLTLPVTGEVQAVHSTAITAPFWNAKIKFLAEEGYVKKGDLLVEFDTSELQTQQQDRKLAYALAKDQAANKKTETAQRKIELENTIKKAQLDVEASGASHARAKQEYDRKEQMVNRGLYARTELEGARIALLQADNDLKKGQMALDEAKANQATQITILDTNLKSAENEMLKKKNDLDQAEKNLAAAKILAPNSGLVVYATHWSGTGSRKVQVGDSLWEGETVLNFPDLSELVTIMKVEEMDIDRVQVGQKVNVKVDSMPDHPYEGEVIKKGAVAVTSLGGEVWFGQQGPQVKGFEVRVSIQKPDERLRPGMTTRNDIVLEQVPNAVWAPIEAVFDRENDHIVYAKDGNRYRAQRVELGKRSPTDIQITKGLKGGETLLLVDPTKSTKRYAPKPATATSTTSGAAK